jgi:hypothetical protein
MDDLYGSRVTIMAIQREAIIAAGRGGMATFGALPAQMTSVTG